MNAAAALKQSTSLWDYIDPIPYDRLPSMRYAPTQEHKLLHPLYVGEWCINGLVLDEALLSAVGCLDSGLL